MEQYTSVLPIRSHKAISVTICKFDGSEDLPDNVKDAQMDHLFFGAALNYKTGSLSLISFSSQSFIALIYLLYLS
jgi:hypothetical protein